VVGTVVNYAGIVTVDAVLIDGKIRKWGGELVGTDYRALLREGERSRERLFEAFGTTMAEARAGLTHMIDRAQADADETMKSFVDRPDQR